MIAIINGELKRRNITTSVSNLTRVEVTSGLPDNASVALSALDNHPLTEGMRVEQR